MGFLYALNDVRDWTLLSCKPRLSRGPLEVGSHCSLSLFFVLLILYELWVFHTLSHLRLQDRSCRSRPLACKILVVYWRVCLFLCRPCEPSRSCAVRESTEKKAGPRTCPRIRCHCVCSCVWCADGRNRGADPLLQICSLHNKGIAALLGTRS